MAEYSGKPQVRIVYKDQEIGVDWAEFNADRTGFQIEPMGSPITARVLSAEEQTLFERWAASMEMFNTQAAARIWEERGGIVVCECDDPDCFAVIEMTRDEYLHASGPRGFWRVTAAGCACGVVGYKLEARNSRYLSWSK